MDRFPNHTTCLMSGPVLPTMPNGIRIRSAVFPKCTGQTDAQTHVRTDRPTDRSRESLITIGLIAGTALASNFCSQQFCPDLSVPMSARSRLVRLSCRSQQTKNSVHYRRPITGWVHFGKTADRIRMPFGIVGRTGPDMRQAMHPALPAVA